MLLVAGFVVPVRTRQDNRLEAAKRKVGEYVVLPITLHYIQTSHTRIPSFNLLVS